MNSKEQKLINSAIPLPDDSKIDQHIFNHIYIINSSRKYNGFWGKCDFNAFIVLGSENNKLYNITHNYQVDVVEIKNDLNCLIRQDIPSEYNCIHMWAGWGDDYGFKIPALISNLILQTTKISK